MIKFLHAADFHLDSPFAGLSPEQAARRRQEQRNLLRTVGELCRKNECDLLLLSGDLFDGQRVYRDTLDSLRDTLADCGAQVFIAPGNHDPIGPTSPYLTEAWPENVHVFTAAAPQAVLLEQLGCTVSGAAFRAPTMGPMLTDFRVEDANKDYVNFMVLHGDVQTPDSEYDPITPAEIAATGLDYLALGHIHKASTLYHTGHTYYAWPGCPMGRGFDETGAKGVFLGEAEKDRVSCRFLPLGHTRYESLSIEAGSDPLESILSALPDDTQNHIYRISLTGESEGIDLDALHQALDGRFYALQLRDLTVPPLELWTRSGENTLEGLSLHTLRQALDRCENDDQRRAIELAARRIAEVCEGREAPPL